jgi:hypothetical protein
MLPAFMVVAAGAVEWRRTAASGAEALTAYYALFVVILMNGRLLLTDYAVFVSYENIAMQLAIADYPLPGAVRVPGAGPGTAAHSALNVTAHPTAQNGPPNNFAVRSLGTRHPAICCETGIEFLTTTSDRFRTWASNKFSPPRDPPDYLERIHRHDPTGMPRSRDHLQWTRRNRR